MPTFGVRIILILIVIAGTVAFIGDRIGHIIGRKRLSLFNLRPRSTAAIFTVITGTLIALTTLFVLLAVSNDARTALFGLEELRNDLYEKGKELSRIENERKEIEKELLEKIAEKEKIDLELVDAKESLNRSQKEIALLKTTKTRLANEISSLEKQVQASRKGTLLFKVGDTLILSLIQAGPEKDKLETGLKQILSAADIAVRSRGVRGETHLIVVRPEDFNQTVADLQARRGEVVVRLIVTQNTIFGEAVPARFELSDYRLVYRTDETIAEVSIPGSLSVPEIEQEIKKLLYSAHQKARADGVLPDPSGSLGSVPYSEIFSLARKININNKGVQIKALAQKDIYSIGPLEIKFRVYYK